MAFLIAETDVPSCPVWGPRPSRGFHHKGAEPRAEPFETTITPKQPDNQTPSSPQKVKRPCQGVAMKEKPLPPQEGDICCRTPREQPTWAKEHENSDGCGALPRPPRGLVTLNSPSTGMLCSRGRPCCQRAGVQLRPPWALVSLPSTGDRPFDCPLQTAQLEYLCLPGRPVCFDF